MQLGKYKERSLRRKNKFSFKLYYGLILLLSGLIMLTIGIISKIL